MNRFWISGAFLTAFVALAFLACGEDESPVDGGPPPDTTPPMVDSVVSVDDHHVEVYYNEAVQKESAERSSSYMIARAPIPFDAAGVAPGDTIAVASVSLKPDGKTAVVSTGDPMSHVPYDLSVCCVRDVSNNQMSSPVTTSFMGTSAVDTTPPEIVYRSPVPDATGVGTASPVIVQFSEMVIGYSVFDGFTWTGGGGDVLWDMGTDDDITFVFTPLNELATNTLYTVSLSGVVDYAVNAMPMEQWSFRTRVQADTDPPTLESSSPGDGETNVSVNANLVLTFSEAMDQTQFEATLSPSAGDGLAVWSNRGRTITFDPDLPLQDDTQYYLFFLPGGARDLSGNDIAATSVRFSTGSSFATGSFAGRVSGDPGTQAANPAGALIIAPDVLPFNGSDNFNILGSAIVGSGGGQNYSITALPDGVYYPVSAMDSNGDGTLDTDLGDAIGAYGFDVRTGDFTPDSVTISGGASVSNVNFPLFDPMVIAGTFSYDGVLHTVGDFIVYIGAFDVNGFDINNLDPPVFGTQQWWPYNVEFLMSEMETPFFVAGSYYIGAYMDVNANTTYDPTVDPAGFYGGVPNPTQVNVNNGQDAIGLHISIVDPVVPSPAHAVAWHSPEKRRVEWFDRLSALVRAAQQSNTAAR